MTADQPQARNVAIFADQSPQPDRSLDSRFPRQFGICGPNGIDDSGLLELGADPYWLKRKP
jgi:hypothetical protein